MDVPAAEVRPGDKLLLRPAEIVPVDGILISDAADSQYQRIVVLVEQAATSKAPVVRLADRYAGPFTAFSLVVATVAWIVSGDPARFAEVLVVATPCPLLIAAPVRSWAA